MEHSPPFLIADGLRVVYPGPIVALDDVDLSAIRAETVALVGESGSGKSTLLKSFNRMVEPSAGRLELDGQPIDREPAEHLRRRVGYVQQDGGLLPHWTVQRNVELVPWLLGWASDRRGSRSRELLALVGLDPDVYADRHPRALSGGQRQRVAFARALAADPELLLLDEPFGALDPITREELHDEFLRWKGELGKTTLFVTHDLNEALRLADRIAVLKDGKIHQIARPDELRAQPATEYVAALLRRMTS